MIIGVHGSFCCLFLLLCRVLVAACRVCCVVQDLSLWYTGSRTCGLGSCGVQAWLLCGMWGLSSSTRDQTHIPCIGRWILNHWTTREIPPSGILSFSPAHAPRPPMKAAITISGQLALGGHTQVEALTAMLGWPSKSKQRA